MTAALPHGRYNGMTEGVASSAPATETMEGSITMVTGAMIMVLEDQKRAEERLPITTGLIAVTVPMTDHSEEMMIMFGSRKIITATAGWKELTMATANLVMTSGYTARRKEENNPTEGITAALNAAPIMEAATEHR